MQSRSVHSMSVDHLFFRGNNHLGVKLQSTLATVLLFTKATVAFFIPFTFTRMVPANRPVYLLEMLFPNQ